MTAIRYLKGDATSPQAAGTKIVCHICNDLGKWGAGFVLAVSARWPEPEADYRQWYAGRWDNGFALGAVQFVQVEPHVWVANMIGQRGIKTGSNGPPIRYPAVEGCLDKVADEAIKMAATVHMPRIGCGLAGGKWDEIEPLIIKTLTCRGISVSVYDFN